MSYLKMEEECLSDAEVINKRIKAIQEEEITAPWDKSKRLNELEDLYHELRIKAKLFRHKALERGEISYA